MGHEPELLLAVKAGDVQAAARLLRDGADVNGADAAGYIPLHWAVVKGDAAMVDLLLAHPDINVNRPDHDDCPALFTAVVRGFNDIVEALVAHPRIDVGRTFGGMTPLLAAVAVDDRSLAEALLTKSNPDKAGDCAGVTIDDFVGGMGRMLPVQFSILDQRYGIDRADLWDALVDNGVILDDGTISETFKRQKWQAVLHLPPAFTADAQTIHDLIDYCLRGDRRMGRLLKRAR